MKERSTSWRLWLGALAIIIGVAGVSYTTMCPKGLVRFAGNQAVGSLSCIDYGGISTPEHYINLKDRGRLGFFGGPLAGEGGHLFLMRTQGDQGKWLCGTTKSVKFSFRSGSAKVENLSVFLDEAKVQRTGTVQITGVGGGVFGPECRSTQVTVDGTVLKMTFEPSSGGGGANQARTDVELRLAGQGVALATQLSLSSPWPERGPADVGVDYGWIRLTETKNGAPVRRVAVAGSGSRLIREEGCARLELASVSALAACPTAEPGTGSLEIDW